MATRFYLPSGGSAPITPSPSSEWESTGSVESFPTSTSKQGSALTSKTVSLGPATTPYDVARLRYVSPPLTAQTITGTVKGQMRNSESWADNDTCTALVIKVVSGDGGTLRGTLLSYFPSSLTSEWSTSLTNRYCPPSGTALSSLEIQNGDRLVIEIGCRRFSTAYGTQTWRCGDAASSDLPEDETSTSDYNPWIEFTHNFGFVSELQVGQVVATVEYTPGSPRIEVSHIGVQVEYTPTPPGQFTYAGNVTAITSVGSDLDADYAYTGNIGATIGVTGTYSFQDGTDYTYIGGVSVIVTPSSTIVRGRAYVGGIYCYIGVSSVSSSQTRIYVGNVGAVIGVAGVCSMPVTGWDKYFGYGLVEVDDLSEPPPFWCVEEGDDNQVVVTVGPEANYSFYAEFDLSTSGGLTLGTGTIITDLDPSATHLETLGEIRCGGRLTADHVDPRAYPFETTDGPVLGGASAFSYVDPADIPQIVKETRGGMVMEGLSAITATDPATFVTSHATSGGPMVGEVRRPPVEHVVPTAAESDITVMAVSGGILLGGTGAAASYVPPESMATVTSGGLGLEGGCTVVVELPVVLALEIMGGMAAGGLAATVFVDVVIHGGQPAEGAQKDLTGEVFETWVLNGFTFEPSIYSGFNFNSYAEIDGKHHAAGADGIYLLEGDTDDGLPIHPGVRLGPLNFNTVNPKRIRSIHLQSAGDTVDVRLVGETSGQESFFSKDDRDRISASRTLQDEAITVEIVNFKELSQIEITPVILEKR